ncbi:MAG: hypothetical protein ACO1QR_12440 [Chthoniobacteraceae bacterium]
MQRPLAVLLPLLLALGLAGCTSGKKESSSHLHEGDAPTIRYHGTEAAGSPLNTY